jgi:hypothetical protein
MYPAVAEADALGLEYIDCTVRWSTIALGTALLEPSHFLTECRHTWARVARSSIVRPASARPARIWAPVIRTSSMAIIFARRWFPSTVIRIAIPVLTACLAP